MKCFVYKNIGNKAYLSTSKKSKKKDKRQEDTEWPLK